MFDSVYSLNQQSCHCHRWFMTRRNKYDVLFLNIFALVRALVRTKARTNASPDGASTKKEHGSGNLNS